MYKKNENVWVAKDIVDLAVNAAANESETYIDLDILFDRVLHGLQSRGLDKSFILIQHENTILLLNRETDKTVTEYCIGDKGELYQIK